MHRALPRASRRPVLATSAVLLTLGLAACGDGATASALDERAQWTQAALPASAQLAGESVAFTGSLGRTAELPWLVAGVGADPGDPATARVWTETDDGWRWDELPVGDDGEATVSAVTTDGSDTWIAGWTWAAGDQVRPFLLSSPDRREWSVVELPDEAAERAVQPGGVVEVGDRLLVVGRDGDQAPVLVVAGEGGEVVDLPAPPDGRDFEGFTGVAATGDTVVAVARGEEPGRSTEPLVYTSPDAGVSWSVARGPVAEPATPAGIAVQAGAFVVTGSRTDAAGTKLPAAWSSADGVTWTEEALPALDSYGLEARDGEDVWLAGPSAGAERLVAPVVAAFSLRHGVVERDAAGAWAMAGSTTDWQIQGIGSVVGVQEDGSVLVAQSARNGGRLGKLDQGGRYATLVAELGTVDAGARWSDFFDAGAGAELLGYTTVTDATGNGGWWQSNQLSRYAVAGTSVMESPWDPAESQERTTLVAATNEQGASVLIGSGSVGERDLLDGWFRTGPGAPWSAIAVENSGADWVGRIVAVDSAWVALGIRRADTRAGSQQTAGVWTSADGTTWTAAQGAFPAAAGDSWANGACALPGGDLLVVGGEDDGPQTRPVAWRGAAELWQRVDPAAFGQVYGDFASCVSVDGRTVVQGTSAGRPTTWVTEDGTSFEDNVVGERGDSFSTIRVVDGGFAAAGTLGSAGQQGAVVWLSEDGRTWRAVAVPSSRVLEGADVIPDGSGGLVVATNSSGSPEVWLLADYAELFSA